MSAREGVGGARAGPTLASLSTAAEIHAAERLHLDSAGCSALTVVLFAIACAPPLYLRFVPMADLPQYLALGRIVTQLRDPALGFDAYYTLAYAQAPALLPLWALGWLAQIASPAAAARIVACASVAIYPATLCLLLRVQGKPIALALLGMPLVYACPFFLGLVPSSLSAGLAILLMALLGSERRSLAVRAASAIVAGLLPLTHPFGVAIATLYVGCLAVSRRRHERQLPWPWLTPLWFGAVYWAGCVLLGGGVASYSSPSLVSRLVRLPEHVLGGFAGLAQIWLLGAFAIVWQLLRRRKPLLRASTWLDLAHTERALLALVLAAVVGYALLPSSTWHSTALHTRAGWLALALLPALLPAEDLRGLRGRALALLLALAVATTWHNTERLIAFDHEARPMRRILDQVPARPKLIALNYDFQGHVASGAPYLHFGAFAQAERGGLLALSLADTDWAVPVRRRTPSSALPPVFGSEWDPALLHVQPHQFEFYDTVLVRGNRPRDMTLFMNSPFRLVLHAGEFLLYVRH